MISVNFKIPWIARDHPLNRGHGNFHSTTARSGERYRYRRYRCSICLIDITQTEKSGVCCGLERVMATSAGPPDRTDHTPGGRTDTRCADVAFPPLPHPLPIRRFCI